MKKIILPLLAIAVLTGCKKDDATPPAAVPALKYETPATYNFSNVAYPGQTDRLNMLAALKSEVSKSHAGNVVDEQTLLDMYSNPTEDGAAFTDPDQPLLGSSKKNLSGKTEPLAKTAMEKLLKEIALESTKTGGADTAYDGKAGLVPYKTGHILVNKHGQEYAQLVEKGLMGSCFYYQIASKYLSDTKIGKDKDGTEELDKTEAGKDYTNREHHFDEAFGYFGVPTNWDKVQDNDANPEVRFWGKYCTKRNDLLKTNAIFDNFIKGRAAIGADGGYHVDQEAEVTKIKETLEQIAAATAINYLKKSASEGDLGKKLHSLTEGLCFLRATQYGGPNVQPADVKEIEELLNNGNFFTITPTQINAAVDKLSSVAKLDAFKASL
jgi:hypothetical protein